MADLAAPTTFEEARELTGWRRPPGDHHCKPAEIIPGLWTAHFHEMDSQDKLQAISPKINLVVNSATCQCNTPPGFFGESVKILRIDLEDDPDERKKFDAGKESTSTVDEPGLPVHKRCAGDAKKDFDKVSDAIEETIAGGGAALVHCHASISRSAVFILAYLMRSRRIQLRDAITLMKGKWDATWPNDRFTLQLVQYERELQAPPPPVSPALRLTSFEEARELTGWKRPPGNHGCKPAEILTGLWTAHFHDIDSQEKLLAVCPHIRLVVNTATCQCNAPPGFFGEGVEILSIDLEDDPDERKKFDAGLPTTSRCAEAGIPPVKRCAGDAKRDFDRVVAAIEQTTAGGGAALVHCHASISRSAAFILAYMLRSKRLHLRDAIPIMKARWDATWPNDRFMFQLVEYERELAVAGPPQE